MEPLVEAIELKQVVNIEYKSIQRKEISSRLIHPYLLKEYDDRWYLFGYDENSDEERIFGLDRIEDLKTIPAKKYKFYTGNLQEVFSHTIGVSRFVGNPEEILLKFSCPQSEYILSKPLHESQTVVEQDEDSITIRLYVRINFELRALVRSFEKQVEVLKPIDLNKEFLGTNNLRGKPAE